MKKLINIRDNVAFNKIVQVCNYFGNNYKGYRRAVAKCPLNKDLVLWFPKLYNNKDWDNKISDNGKIITEIKKEGNEERIKNIKFETNIIDTKRIVYAGEKDDHKKISYVFKGVFELDKEKSLNCGKAIYDRISDEIEIGKSV